MSVDFSDRSDIVGGFPVRQIIIWQRAGGINFNPGYFLPNYEVIYLICKPRFRLAKKANAIGCVWKIPPESKNPHPAPFPVELAQRCIESTTGRIVLDPFRGSGSTALAANAVGRQWIGVELSEAYRNLARERSASSFRAGGEWGARTRRWPKGSPHGSERTPTALSVSWSLIGRIWAIA